MILIVVVVWLVLGLGSRFGCFLSCIGSSSGFSLLVSRRGRGGVEEEYVVIFYYFRNLN